MLVASRPRSFPLVFAVDAPGALIRVIPVNSQIGITDGAASLETGFVEDNFSPLSAGGTPPFGQDFNGLMNQITAWCQWVQAGAPIFYDADFATAIGGYPKGTVLNTSTWCPGTRWISLIDNNLVDPDGDPTGWTQDPNQILAGTIMQMPVLAGGALPFGYVPANGGTIGNGTSNASLSANRITYLLYNNIWRGYPNSQCPVLNSSGVPVGRGASPNADFNANNQIVVPDFRGRGLTGIDTGGSNRLAGVPVISGSLTTAGSIFGENLHQLILAELAAHAHANSLNDPTHVHGVADPGHVHGVADPGHVHALTLLAGTQGLSTAGGTEGWAGGGFAHISINNGVSVDSHATNISINSAGTGLSVSAHSTGLTITNANVGSDTAHNTVAQSAGVIWGLKL